MSFNGKVLKASGNWKIESESAQTGILYIKYILTC